MRLLIGFVLTLASLATAAEFINPDSRPRISMSRVAVYDGINGGETITGGTASSNNLTLKANLASWNSLNTGRIRLDDRVLLMPTSRPTSTSGVAFVDFPAGSVLTQTGAATSVFMYNWSGEIAVAAAPSFGVGPCELCGNGNVRLKVGATMLPGQLATSSLTNIADGAVWTLTDLFGVVADGSGFSIANAGSFAGVYASFSSNPTIATGAGFPTREGLVVWDWNGAGVVTTQVGIQIKSLTKATNNFSLRSDGTTTVMSHAGAARFGDAVVPTTGASVEAAGSVVVYGGNATISGVATQVNGLQTTAAFTISGLLGDYTMVDLGGTVTDTGASSPIFLFHNALYDRTTTTNAASVSNVTGFSNTPTLRANAVALTSGTARGLNDSPTYSITGGGTIAGAIYQHVAAGLTANTGTTVATRTGLLFNDATGAGAVTNQIAVDVPALAKGGTLNVALRSNIAASTGKNYFLDDTGGADSKIKGQLRIGDTTDPTALLDIVGKTTLNTSGVVTKYNNVATVSDGIASEVATIDLTTQGAAIAASTLYAVPAAGAGMYRVTWVATVTRAASTSSVLGGTAGFQIKYTEGGVVKTMPGTIVAGVDTNSTNSTATGTISGCFAGFVDASTTIQYQMDYTSVGVTTMQYSLHVKCEAL